MSVFDKNNISIYFHIPFCKSKCPYCDFNSYNNLSEFDEDEFIEGYINHIKYWKSIIGRKYVKSIFFGGGTPSIIKTDSIKKIIDSVKSKFDLLEDCEISIEINPATVDENILKEYVEIGINRLSIGMQSLNNKDLKFLGRLHSAEEALEALEIGKKYFKNISADFIYSLPNQTAEEWETELKKILKLDLPHYSIYQLTIEKNTPFGKAKIKIPTDEKSLSLFETTRNIMSENKCRAYEISNFSKEGFECIHNRAYWDGSSYIGIGAGAHGRALNDGKWTATEDRRSPKRWLEKSKNPAESYKIENLSKEERCEEILITSLRTKYGFNLKKYKGTIDLNLEEIQSLEKNNIITVENGFLKLTEKGIPLINHILPRLIN